MNNALGDVSEVHTYCGLCKVGCPAVVSTRGGTVVALEADRSHPQGGAICAKGRAAPEILDHPHRVNFPLRRTRPKTDSDPGWVRCSWDEALDLVATRLAEIRASDGPHAVAFGRGTGGGTALKEAEPWLARLANTFGSPNFMTTTHLCNWPRDGAAMYTYGTASLPFPEVLNSGCIVLWGTNPSATALTLATDTVAARARGARLVVIDPRRVGLANKADVHLPVRPGTDGALALGFINILLQERRFDEGFVRQWTNAPLLVRSDTGRLLRVGDVAGHPPDARPGFAALDADTARVAAYDPSTGEYSTPPERLDLRGSVDVNLSNGRVVRCATVLEVLAQEAGAYTPDVVSRITATPEHLIRQAVQLIASNRPVAHYLYNGMVQHTNASQACRAIEIFYALLGDFDQPGGNVVPMPPRSRDIAARSLLPLSSAEMRLGLAERPLGPPARPGNIAAYDLYSAILEHKPYRVRGLLSFGGNTIIANGDTLRGRAALENLEFFAQAELFFTPTSQYADVLLPAASFMEGEALYVSDGLTVRGDGMAQRRPQIVPALYERRTDVEVIFDLACRLGLRDHFGGGDRIAAYNEILEPVGLSWDSLSQHQSIAVRVSEPRRYAKYAELDEAGRPRGFATPTRKVELYAETFAQHELPPFPQYVEPAESPVRTPHLARQYPLVLTNAKRPQYLHSQHRAVTSLRRTMPHPTAEIHPETAAEYGVDDGMWIIVETPRGRARAVADVTSSIMPGIVCANAGWWEACEELGLAPMDPFSQSGSNLNLLVHNDQRDPISGSVPHRSSLCRIRPADEIAH